jgi:hypothetical protein
VGVVNESRTEQSMYVEERWAREGDGAGPGLPPVCTAACQESGGSDAGQRKDRSQGTAGRGMRSETSVVTSKVESRSATGWGREDGAAGGRSEDRWATKFERRLVRLVFGTVARLSQRSECRN